MGWQELFWLGTADPCSSCSQCTHSFTQWVPAAVKSPGGATDLCKPSSAGKSLKRMESVHPLVPALKSLTDLVPNTGLMAPEAAFTVKGAKVDTPQTHRGRSGPSGT